MTRLHKLSNLIGVALPPVSVVVAIALLWNRRSARWSCLLLLGMYLITITGVTLGYHRMFTHRAFEASRAFRRSSR